MNLALIQAKINIGSTKNNPSVGCVIVKNKNVIGIGRTGINGTPHAEKNAINFCSNALNNSTLYSTLEPCIHYGKTPPCTNLIKLKKIKKVFFSIHDPDLRTHKQSEKVLKRSGIKVSNGLLLKEIKKLYKSYFKSKKQTLPFVTAKIAVSKDHFTVNKKNKWITNSFSRGRVHLMRSQHDCIITSYKTIIKDNPMLNCRIKGLESRSPARIIIDKNLKTPINSKIIQTCKKIPTIIFYNKPNVKKVIKLKKLKVKLIKISIEKKNNFDLKKILLLIKKLGYSRIFLESGVHLCNSFFKYKLVNELQVFMSSKKIDKLGAFKITNSIKKILNKKPSTIKVNLFGDELKSYIIR